jgi:hypothetical protein
MTGIVYETQHWTNPEIRNYVDALYFTVTALITTGFGDITLRGTTGRLISVVIMIFGVTLFLRLLRSLLQPQKVFDQLATLEAGRGYPVFALHWPVTTACGYRGSNAPSRLEVDRGF